MRLTRRYLLVVAILILSVSDVFAQDLLGMQSEASEPTLSSTPYDRLMRTLDEREQSFEHRLDRFQSQAQWTLERLEGLHDQLLEEIGTYADQRAAFGSVPGSRRPQLLGSVQARLSETVQRIRRLEEAHDSHLDALLEATALTRQLRLTVDSEETVIEQADLAQTEEELAAIEAAIDFQHERRAELLEDRAQVEEHLTEQRELLDLARDELLTTELAESERQLARDQAVTRAITVGLDSESVAQTITVVLAEQRRQDHEATFRLQQILQSVATIPVLTFPVVDRGDRLVTTVIEWALRLTSHTFRQWHAENREAAIERARSTVVHALERAWSTVRGDPVSEDLEPLEQILLAATVRLRERECELARGRVETINLRLEVVGLQLGGLEYRRDLWLERREESAARASGGILNRERSHFDQDYWEELWTNTQVLIAHPGQAWDEVQSRVAESKTESLTVGILVLILAIGVVTFLVTRGLLRLLKSVKSKGIWTVALVDGLRVSVFYIPLSAALTAIVVINLAPQPTHLFLLFIATAPPLVNGVLRSFKHLLPPSGTELLTPQVSRYLRRVIRFTLLTAATLQGIIAIIPLLGYGDDARQPLWALFLLTLLSGWVGLLIRKVEILALIGADRAKMGTPIGMLQSGIRRTYPIFVLGPIFIAVVYLLGFRNLAAVIFRRGLIILLILIAVPWLNARLHDYAKRVLAYPEGGGPLALSAENSQTAYRSLAPIITIAVGLLGLGLLALSWDREGNFLGNIANAMTYPIFHLGEADITGVSIIVFTFAVSITYIIIKWTLATLRKSFYPLYELTPGMRASIDTLVKYALFLIGAIIGLQIIGVGIGFLAIFAGIVGIGIGFGSQTLAANFIAGLILQFTKPIEVGDVIEVEGVTGHVLRITTHATIIKTFNNRSVIVPNSSLLGGAVTNWSEGGKDVRLSIGVGVAYGSDVNLVTDLLLQVAREHPKARQRPKPAVRFENFGDSSLDFALLLWIDEPRDAPQIRSEIRYAINTIFGENEIEIPFPQRDLNLRAQERVIEIVQKKGWAFSDKEEAEPGEQKEVAKKEADRSD